MLQNIAVYCGSSQGNNVVYKQAAIQLGETFVANNVACVFGAGSVGLMGIIADTMVALGGKTIGVIPQFLVDWEVCHQNLTETHVTQTMHERKALMCQMAEGFLALPGGFGTLDELFEILTWGQLALHQKPVGILNVNGFFDGLLAQIQVMVKEGFLKKENAELLIVETNLDTLLQKMAQGGVKADSKWIN